jgi:hypothetical protein
MRSLFSKNFWPSDLEYRLPCARNTGFVDNAVILPDLLKDTVKINNRIDCIQWLVFLFDNLLHNGISVIHLLVHGGEHSLVGPSSLGVQRIRYDHPIPLGWV